MKVLLFEITRNQLALHWFIVDDQNMKRIGHLDLRTIEREGNLEAAAAACLVRNRDRSAVSFDNPLGDRQTQPGALDLGGKVRLEDAREIFRRDPGSGIRSRR